MINLTKCFVIKKNPGSTSNPWLMQMTQDYGGRLCYGSLEDLIIRSGIATLKTFNTAKEAREYVRADQEKFRDIQICSSDSVFCELEITSNSIKISIVED